MASSSSSSSLSFINERKYDVFISFRGIDTRSGFTGSLHRALRGKEIKSFMDDQDLEKGAEINPVLDEAIQSSRIALVVLSKNYASSTFCLDELRKIMDCSKDQDMLVLPVFYEIEPSDVRYQKGKYADALNKHEARISEKETIEKWRIALEKIAHLSGWHFNHDRYEYELIDDIVQVIIKKIHSLRDGEAHRIVAAMKIQQAFRKFESRKIKKAAAVWMQHRTRKLRREFLHMGLQAIKIQIKTKEKMNCFIRTSRKQAEECVESSVGHVQAMFRSKKAQEYRRLELAHSQAKLEPELEEVLNSTHVEVSTKPIIITIYKPEAPPSMS